MNPLRSERARRWNDSTRLARLTALALIILGLIRIVSTYRVFSPTYDEPAHLATGMELLSRGRYEYEPQHPPLGRIAAAALPYVSGLRTRGLESFWTEGHTLIHDSTGMSYRDVTSLARLGMLPFFVVICGVVWAWTKRLVGEPAAAVGVLFVSMAPSVLAHASLATTDIAATATFGLALMRFALWLESASASRSLLLGASAALAVLSKFTAVLFLPFGALGVLGAYLLSMSREERPSLRQLASLRRSVAPAACAFFLVVWGGYLFSVGSISNPADRPYESVDAALGEGPVRGLAYGLLEAKIVPAVELLHGIRQVIEHVDFGHRSYFLGQVGSEGWPLFFPIAFLVKNPAPFVFLFVVGVILLSRDRGRRCWLGLAAAGAALCILAAAVPSRINIGFRHVLPILPMVAVVASYGTVCLWNTTRARTLSRGLVLLLTGSLVVSSARAHPDYLSYFNFFAGDRPDRVLPYSDVDWGQDLNRLANELSARGVQSLTIATGVDIPFHFLESSMGFPHLTAMPPLEPVTGWVAVDVYSLRMGSMHDLSVPVNAYNWVERFEPVAEAGPSFRLYYFPPASIDSVRRVVQEHRGVATD